jgi:hypothetical protein
MTVVIRDESPALDPARFESIVGRLGADELAHLGSLLSARARARRRTLTALEAWAAYRAAPLTAAWERSVVPEVGRVRAAARILVARNRLHPEQIVDAMTEVAEAVCCHPLVAAEAVAAGIADGRSLLEGSERG